MNVYVTSFRFSPEALGVQFTNGLLCWLFQVLLMEATLHMLGDGEILLLDVVAYSGYTFVAVSIALVAKVITCGYCYYVVSVWKSFCMGTLFVKILKRILVAEVRICEKHSSKRHYHLSLAFGCHCSASIAVLFWKCLCLIIVTNLNSCVLGVAFGNAISDFFFF